ncbi:MAG: GAF domain-containing protein [Gemmatimonadetes bacterium]|nr:GAF domain-containing protein [Gemmatimonadota bacterium]MCA9761625.1 GAF domain-containing protein [Gemmatimonadota bacterium]MCA9768652.1 GAF domain-containing protein [Gemmatimonadota bacterium]HPF60654.1 ATP-binding protein [Gemmatimonadales bacterium]HRX19778.1 ATP-binding protein [Gemmatimonadales bacterium]
MTATVSGRPPDVIGADGQPVSPTEGGQLRWLTTSRLVTSSLVLGWVCVILLVLGQRAAGLGAAALSSGIAVAAIRRGRRAAEHQKASLSRALTAASRRNGELERLRELAARLLEGTDLPTLNRLVAQAAGELLDAEGGAIMLMVEEGRFAKLVAGSGPLQSAEGALVPIEQSLVGYAILNDEAVLVADIEADARNHPHEQLTGRITGAAMVPLRSAGMVVGAVCAFNRRDGRPFTDHDRQLLQSLGDQVVLGLDRTTVLEELRRNERQLATKNRELQRATQLKSEFLANMSHELRTPLNAIIGFSDLMLSEGLGPLEDQQKEFLESILRNGRHLLGLINSVLDLSKIEAGRMVLTLDQCDVRTAIEGAVTDTTSLRSGKGQQAEIRIEDGEALEILADRIRVRQVLFNLLSNASKFTGDGGLITVTAVRTVAPMPSALTRRAGDTVTLVPRDVVWVSVADTGVGIPEEHTDKLFREFSQVDASASRAAQGTGLGLALCKRFVEMHGGQIGVESIEGKGSTFWFLLPVDGPPPAKP